MAKITQPNKAKRVSAKRVKNGSFIKSSMMPKITQPNKAKRVSAKRVKNGSFIKSSMMPKITQPNKAKNVSSKRVKNGSFIKSSMMPKITQLLSTLSRYLPNKAKNGSFITFIERVIERDIKRLKWIIELPLVLIGWSIDWGDVITVQARYWMKKYREFTLECIKHDGVKMQRAAAY